MANSLDDTHSRQQSKHCVRLSAHGYRMMYHVQYDTTSLLSEIETQGRSWLKSRNFNSRTCLNVYP